MRNIGILILVGFLFGCVETLDSTYKDYVEAKQKGAIVSGWVPTWFPKTAYDISESHNIDTNQIIIGWKNHGEWNVPNECKQIGPYEAPAPGIQRSWWPSDIPASKFSTHRHVFYVCGRGEYLAVEPNLNEGYYWNVGR